MTWLPPSCFNPFWKQTVKRNLFGLIILSCFLILSLIVILAPAYADRLYGPPGSALGVLDRLEYSIRLLWHDGTLTTPRDRLGNPRSFRIESGQSVIEIAGNLESAGLISSSQAFYDYVVYAGMDSTLQAGDYELTPSLSIVQLAAELQDATPDEITFVVLPGWRLEEIAESIPTSGFSFSPQDFLTAAHQPSPQVEFLPVSASAEGFLSPDEYLLPRSIQPAELIAILLRKFTQKMTPELLVEFSNQGLDLFQAITLASIVERETVQESELPQIASVFLNRLKAGIKLDSDATVQYANGFNPSQSSWWSNPLRSEDFLINSPYNTYIYPGLPPSPIANPGSAAINAVAHPAETSFLYFQARCDGSGYHVFNETFEEHLQNSCP
jgi:UPF0755 protein